MNADKPFIQIDAINLMKAPSIQSITPLNLFLWMQWIKLNESGLWAVAHVFIHCISIILLQQWFHPIDLAHEFKWNLKKAARINGWMESIACCWFIQWFNSNKWFDVGYGAAMTHWIIELN